MATNFTRYIILFHRSLSVAAGKMGDKAPKEDQGRQEVGGGHPVIAVAHGKLCRRLFLDFEYL